MNADLTAELPAPSTRIAAIRSDAHRARMLAVQHRLAMLALASVTLNYHLFNARERARLGLPPL